MRSAVVFAIIALILAAAAGLIAYLLYRKKLNEAVQSGEHPTHSKVAAPGEVIPKLIIVLLLVWDFILLINISSLRTQLLTAENNVMGQIGQLKGQISDLEKQLKAQELPLKDYDFTPGALDRQSLTFPLHLTATPKEVSDDTRLILTYGSRQVEMTRGASGIYTADVTFGLFEEIPEVPTIQILSGGKTQIETLDSAIYGAGFWSVFLPLPDIFTSDLEMTLKNGTLSVSGSVACGASGSKDGVNPVKASLELVHNGSVIKTIPLEEAINPDGKPQQLTLKESIASFGENDEFLIAAVLENDLDLTVRQVAAWYAGGSWKESDSGIQILDKSGKVLYE